MFNKILIANRGEIACRVIKTARSMGIETIAIYSDVDSNSLHVQKADRACRVGSNAAIDSYLNSDAIINAAIKSGADAIHPGYGFLSENTGFAKACADAGMVFIGPSIAAMEAMASKQLAKQLLEKTGIPLIPGYHGRLQSNERLLEEARLIGFPVLLKAACGGGGKGMRTVHSEADFMKALAGARREAMASFADDTMIIEKFIDKPRHIEIQIMADNFGKVVHLFERDCSIQRRHQKIIEEAPAPGLSDALRQKLTAAACQVARSINYQGAGTVEFLTDNDEHFYFMEMNTRLQVEHPVTEMITGLDLVFLQIIIAANQPLPMSQTDIIKRGHAIECRIYAEDPHHDFLPSTGHLHLLAEPAGIGIRIDSGVCENAIISQYYDPMMAKLIAYGESREQALQRLQQALKNYAIGGVTANIPFLQAICQHPRFIAADFNTNFLAEEAITMPQADLQVALMMATAFDYLELVARERDPLFRHCFAWQMHLSPGWSCRYIVDNQEKQVSIEPLDHEQFVVETEGRRIRLKAQCKNRQMTLMDDDTLHRAWITANEHSICCYFENGQASVGRFTWQGTSRDAHQATNQMTAPMPSTIVALLKKPGDLIKKGEPLMVLEAMKMEHTIQAPHDGMLVEFFYETGAQVREGASLFLLDDGSNGEAP